MDNEFFNFDAVAEIEKKKSYNQALDDFKEKCEEKIKEICLKAEDDIPFLDIFDIKKIAEQLKEQKNE